MNKSVHAATFADLFSGIDADMGLHPQKAANLKSSIRRFLNVVGWTETMEASFPRVRRKLKDAMPAKAGVGKATWANTRSDLKFVLDRYGVPNRAPLRKHLTPEWACLRDMVDDAPKFARGLSNFMHFCAGRDIPPDDVDDAVVDAYHKDLLERSLKINPDRLCRQVCKLWNEAIEIYPDWPRIPVTVPSFRKTISFPWDAFPKSFLDDIEAYKAHMSIADIFDENALDKPLEESTIRSNVEAFRRLASAIIRSGMPAQEITSLSCLIQERELTTGLMVYKEYLGDLHCPSIHNLIGSLISLAENYLLSDGPTLRRIRDLRKRAYTRKRGMTSKNAERLHQFVSPDNRRAFICLGDRLVEEARKIDHPRRRALRIQTALMHEILLVAPIRAKNLTELRIDQHFRSVGKGTSKRLYMILPADEVKNDKDIDFDLPHHVIRLYDLYVSKHRKVLLKGSDEGCLFPGDKGGHKSQVTVSGQLTKAVSRLTGININLHLYRHIAALIYLDRHPGQYETVRVHLGHKSIETTMMFYAAFSDTNARRHVADTILALRFNQGD